MLQKASLVMDWIFAVRRAMISQIHSGADARRQPERLRKTGLPTQTQHKGGFSHDR